MKLCVIKPDETIFKTGDQVFICQHTESGDIVFDNEHVTLFDRSDTDLYVAKLHISKVRFIDDYMIEKRFGRNYLKPEYSQFK